MKQIISAAITPFTDDNKIDPKSAAKLYEFGLKNGLDGFFIFGSMGEWALLTLDEKLALSEIACDVIGNKAKILLGISDTGLPNILNNMEKLGHLKHSHWTFLLPGGWAGASDPVKYVHGIADAADRPVYFYNAPFFNGVTFSISQFQDMLAHPNVAGIKNSAGSISVRKGLLLLRQTQDFELYDGDEWAIDEALLLGCDGVIVGCASAAGKLMKTIAAQVDSGDYNAAMESQFRLVRIFHSVFGVDRKWWSAGQKYALQYMGVISSGGTRIDAQQEMPESHKAAVRECVDVNREYLL